MKFTAEQQKIVDDRGHDILVSASAGSGKTTVLVARVLAEIEAGLQVDNLLVVTFTKAAAAQMKQRIKAKLTELLTTAPAAMKAHLRRQLVLVDTANISTIDAFCLNVIRRFYYVVDLDPSFSILTDPTQFALLKEKALTQVEDYYLKNQDPDFLAFYNNFAGDRDANFPRQILLDLYNFAMAKPNYQQWLHTLDTAYAVPDTIEASALWQQEVKPYLTTTFADLQQQLVQLLADDAFTSTELAKVKLVFEQFSQALGRYLQALKDNASYDEQRTLLQACQLGSFRKSSKWTATSLTFYEQCQAVKKTIKDLVFEHYSAFYVATSTEQTEVMRQGEKLVRTISKAELRLINTFNQLKRAENLIDYSDMEQLAYTILSQDTSNAKLARQFYQEKFKEILVDEYQDINPLQEELIQLLKKPDHNHLFMVGDVKQSIYGFRQAEPSLFLKKYHDYAETDANKRRILLSDNFRSSRPVTQIVNRLFNQILTPNFGGIDYQHEAQLKFGASYYPAELPTASELLYHPVEANPVADLTQTDNIDQHEIEMVLARIQQMQREHFQVLDPETHQLRALAYQDIAILTRSRTDNLAIMQAFAQKHIPLLITDAETYFQTFELTIIMNYLKLIDNPDQDIPLVSVMRSPIFNFTEPELATIRIKHRKMSFYNAVTAYGIMNDAVSQKLKHFLNQLGDFRQYASQHRLSELIWSIYTRTHLLEMMTILPNGKQRRVNLESLYERAASYESAGFKGLYQFIEFINRIRASKKDLAQPLLTQDAGDAVKLMTIHGSKGLEFPIVFYVGLDHRYQIRDLTTNYVITPTSLGITVLRPHYRVDSLVKAMGNVMKRRQLLEEEVRILYVALTRAQQKLIMVANITSFDKKVAQWQQQAETGLSEFAKLHMSSPLGFVGPALHFDRQLPQSITALTPALEASQSFIYVESAGETAKAHVSAPKLPVAGQDYQLLTKTAKRLFDFTYPFADASRTTAYQSVSEIKKAFNDPLEVELANAHTIASTNRYLQPIDTKPNFLFRTHFTGAELGTASHLLLQYYDYHGDGSPEQLAAEIKTLIANGALDPDLASELKLAGIEWFVHSDFAKPFWAHPDRLKREIDFSSLVPAKQLFTKFSDPLAKVLVHGTIDGYYLGKNGIILFDYKTDHVDQTHLELAINTIKQKYQGQLRLYEQALNAFSNSSVVAKYLILLDCQQIVKLD